MTGGALWTFVGPPARMADILHSNHFNDHPIDDFIRSNLRITALSQYTQRIRQFSVNKKEFDNPFSLSFTLDRGERIRNPFAVNYGWSLISAFR